MKPTGSWRRAQARLRVNSRPPPWLTMENIDMEYNCRELMIIIRRLLRDGVWFCRSGQPNLPCNPARHACANPGMIYEAEWRAARARHHWRPHLVSGAAAVCSMYDVFSLYLQRGNVDVGFGRGADRPLWNINATVIGDYDHPKVRLPGSGGSMEVQPGPTAHHDLRIKAAVSEKVDFRRRLAFCYGGHSRQEAGVRGGGPRRWSPTWAFWSRTRCELILTALHPGARWRRRQT